MRYEKTLERRLLAGACALGALLALGAVDARASEIRIGLTADIQTLDPQNYRDRTTQTVIGNIYDGFFIRGLTGPDEALAVIEEWIEVDPVTYEAVLRDGVRFHSGDPMTIEDVAFTFDRLLREGAIEGQTSPRKSLVGPIERVEIAGPDRVRLHLSAPFARLPGSLALEPILNQSFVEEVGNQGIATQADGAGPFRLVAWNRGDSVVLERFEDYYGGPTDVPPVGPARVDRVTFATIPETSSRVAALLAGEIDIAVEVPVFLRSQIEQNPNTSVVTSSGTRTFFVALNNTRPPFDDIRVRHAANHAVDRQLIVDRVLEGTADLVNGVLSADSFGATLDLPAYEYDPAKAKALLAEAGHADGFDVTLDVTAAFKDLAEAIGSMLTEVGIRTTVQVWEGAVISPLWVNHDAKDRDMYLISWGSAGLHPGGIFLPTLRTRDRGNHSGFSNAEVDRLIDAALAETDLDQEWAYWAEAEAIVNQEAPWIFLWVPQDIYGVSNRLRDWQPHPSAMIYMHRATITE
jgi:peptide/nickel transport system substrate-binding protein